MSMQKLDVKVQNIVINEPSRPFFCWFDVKYNKNWFWKYKPIEGLKSKSFSFLFDTEIGNSCNVNLFYNYISTKTLGLTKILIPF